MTRAPSKRRARALPPDVVKALDVSDAALDLAEELAALLLRPTGGVMPRVWIEAARVAFEEARELVVNARPGRSR